MLMEMHCHTAEHSSCSSVSAVELVQQVYAKRLQGLVLTDHHYVWPDADLAELRRQAGVPADFAVLSGQETNVPKFGDVLIYGASTSIARGTPLEEIRKEFKDIAVVWAHPYRDRREPTQDMLSCVLLDAVEIFNSNHTVLGNSRAYRDWQRYRFTATGGTDTHGASYAGIYPTRFDSPVRTLEELVDGIRSGRCRPFLKETEHREASKVTEVTIGTRSADENRESIIIRKAKDESGWSAAERAFHIMSAIAELGFDKGTFRVPQPIEKNAESMTLIEQGAGGKSLYDALLSSTAEQGREYLRLAARWLARLHGLRLKLTSPEEFLHEEAKRLDRDMARFSKAEHPYTRKLAEIVTAVKKAEEELTLRQRASLVQGHGDYHPKNIFISQETQQEGGSPYIVAIDFERTELMPIAFDVGWFLAQFRSQLADHPKVRADLTEEEFIETYLQEANHAIPPDFPRQVELFRARANISIAAFFVKLKIGGTGELWRVLVEAERALTLVVSE
jgi:3',5'-nucleoside bisphosphate phosphatase